MKSILSLNRKGIRINSSSLYSSLLSLNQKRFINFQEIRNLNKNEISQITEVKQREIFLNYLLTNPPKVISQEKIQQFQNSGMTLKELEQIVEAGLITFLLHVESRVASSVGQGFYTIGPCGEESLSAIGIHLKDHDASALHYRHVAVNILRQLKQGRLTQEIILDRARGFTCSKLDPVTGGKHCAIGGTSYDYIVTSTLASQACPAVGRALSIPLANYLYNTSIKLNGSSSIPLKFQKDSISIVSVGEGSTNNAHFLSALNLAEYSSYNNQKCPVLFIVSDNGVCISLSDKNWVTSGPTSRLSMKRFLVDGSDVIDIYSKTKEATEYCRKYGRPALVLIRGLVRRFGHAATDRQTAYLTTDQINIAANTNHLADTVDLARSLGAFGGENGVVNKFQTLLNEVENAFDLAVNEEKINSRVELCQSNSAPLAPITLNSKYEGLGVKLLSNSSSPNLRLDSLRKHMTSIFSEILSGQSIAGDRVVYIGEDVRHGGYYLVTDGLYSKYPSRVHDFPPDETSILGVGQGLSQSGLLPIIEMPYAKYLDCGYDMFLEIGITYWLSNGRQKDGLIIRVQGFDRGKFGGNYHTHNMISIPPGVDVVCYSNGSDYVSGMRYCLRQALQGRIIMSYDSTDLLNRRHLGSESDGSGKRDDIWLTNYPEKDFELSFDDIISYQGDWLTNNIGSKRISPYDPNINSNSYPTGKLLIVTYGNGLPNCLQAMNRLIESGKISSDNITVIDSPYLSSPPQALKNILSNPNSFQHILFADVCKEGQGMIFSSFVVQLQKEQILPTSWKVIGSQPTYNPLGQTLTFLSSDDVEKEAIHLLEKVNKKTNKKQSK